MEEEEEIDDKNLALKLNNYVYSQEVVVDFHPTLFIKQNMPRSGEHFT